MAEPTISADGVLDAMREGLQVLSPELRYLYVNEAVCRHGRTTRDALLGRRMSEVYPGIEHTEMFARLVTCLRDRVPAEFENEFEYPDRTRAWFELRVTPVPEGIAVLSIDVTHRKELEAQLAATQRLEAIGRLAGGIAHDLNNILTVLQGYGELVSPEVAPGARGDFDAMMSAAGRANALVAHLLAFARKRPVVPRVLDPREALGRLWTVLRRVVHAEIRLVSDFGEVPHVRIDPTALEQVVMNLVLNARDAVSGGGTIRVEVALEERAEPTPTVMADRAPAGPWVVIRVVDDGIGIPPESLPHLFEPFWTTKGGGGTGLGLSTSYGIVRQAGGFVSVRSEPGAGSTFEVLLPPVERASRPSTPPPPDTEPGAVSLVLVEEDPYLRDLLARALRQRGWSVVAVASGAEALGAPGPFDVAVTDARDPDGPSFLDELVARLPGLRVVFTSGAASPGAGLPDGVKHELLPKPFAARDLIARVTRLLAR